MGLLFDVCAALPVRIKRRVEDQTRTVARGRGYYEATGGSTCMERWIVRHVWRYASLRSDRPDRGLLGTGLSRISHGQDRY